MLALLLALLIGLQDPPAADADALWSAGHRMEAIQALDAALAARPDDVALRLELAGRQIEVHLDAAALSTLAPLEAEGRALRARALTHLGRWREALTVLDPDQPEELVLRLEALEALKAFDELDLTLDHAHALLGAVDPRLAAFDARRLARQGDSAAAARAFEALLVKDPQDPDALAGLGQALIALGEQDRGEELLARRDSLLPLLASLRNAREGVDLAPLHAANVAALGDAERALGRLDAAQEHYARALELADEGEIAPVALRQARLLAEDRHDVDGAVRCLEHAAGRAPDARLYVRAGDLLLEDGRPIDAVQRFLLAGELRPSDPAIQRRIEAARAAYRKTPDR